MSFDSIGEPSVEEQTAIANDMIDDSQAVSQLAVSSSALVSSVDLSIEQDEKVILAPTSFAIGSSQLVTFQGSKKERRALLLTLAGLAKQTSGEVAVCGETPAKQQKALREICKIAVFSGVNDLDEELTVEQTLASELSMFSLAKRQEGDDAIDALAAKWDFSDYLDERISELTAEVQIRVAIALADAHKPQIIVIEDVESNMGVHATLHMLKWLSNAAKNSAVSFAVGVSDNLFARYSDLHVEIGA